MDDALRRAWTSIVTAGDYEQHMLNVGQAPALATLTAGLLRDAQLRPGSRVVIAGAGTGQLLDFIHPATLRPFRLTFTDLNPGFLSHLRRRLDAHSLDALVLQDDIEQTAIEPRPDLLLAALVLEHIDWRRGVEVFTSLQPAACAVIIQENPPGMTASVTPGRALPPSIAEAMGSAHATLVPRDQLIGEFAGQGYACSSMAAVEVADAKRLVALCFTPAARR
jgi:hypothetical protein